MGGAELCPSRMASLRRVLRDSPTARKRRWGLDRRAYGYTRSVGGPDLLGRGSHKKRGRRHTHTEGRPREDTGSTRGLNGPERGLGTARLGPAWVSDCCPPGQGEDKPVLFEPPLRGAPGRLPQRTDAVRSRLLCQPVSVTDTGRDRTARASAGGASDSETRSSLSDPVSASPGQLSLCGSAWAPSSGRESGGQRPGGDTRGTGGSPGATPQGWGSVSEPTRPASPERRPRPRVCAGGSRPDSVSAAISTRMIERIFSGAVTRYVVRAASGGCGRGSVPESGSVSPVP